MGTKVTTVVNTSTTTNVRDIGFTGQNAIDLVDILEGSSLEREKLRSDLLRFDAITQAQGYERLIGGAIGFSENVLAAGGVQSQQTRSLFSVAGGGIIGIIVLLVIGFFILRR